MSKDGTRTSTRGRIVVTLNDNGHCTTDGVRPVGLHYAALPRDCAARLSGWGPAGAHPTLTSSKLLAPRSEEHEVWAERL